MDACSRDLALPTYALAQVQSGVQSGVNTGVQSVVNSSVQSGAAGGSGAAGHGWPAVSGE